MKKTLLKTLALFCMMSFPVMAAAQEETKTVVVQYLVVTENSGAETTFELAKQPTITFSDATTMVVKGESELTLVVTDVKNYKFTKEEKTVTSIKQIPTQEVTFKGLKAGETVRVFTLDGRLVGTVKAESDGISNLDLSTLPAGKVYILRTPSTSYKVAVK